MSTEIQKSIDEDQLQRDFSGILQNKMSDHKISRKNKRSQNSTTQHQPVSNEGPTMSRECPAMPREFPAMSRECPAMSRECPAMSCECSATSRECPATSRESPATSRDRSAKSTICVDSEGSYEFSNCYEKFLNWCKKCQPCPLHRMASTYVANMWVIWYVLW